MKNRDDFCFLVFARHIAWLDLILLSTRIFPCCTNQVLRILSILDFDIHFYLLTTETRRAQREFSCPIGRRRSGKRSQPFRQDLVHRWLHVNGWRLAKELSPKAEALFTGQRPVPLKSGAPGQGKTTLLWLNEKRTTLVYKAVTQQTKYTTKEVVQ